MNKSQKVFLGITGGIFGLVALSSMNQSASEKPNAQQVEASTESESGSMHNTNEEATEPEPTPQPERTKEPAKAEPEPAESAGQENARRSAEDYLDYAAFSRSGLIEQLEFEGFTTAQAIYGAKNAGANWNDQAVQSAKDYLDYSAFSKSGLVEQLEFEGFTGAQAAYGANEAF